MPAGIFRGLLIVCAALTMALPAYAENGTFAELLAKAKAQAAAGHRWAPPGDNMTETVMRMMDFVPTATPAQLAELSALLESDRAQAPATASRSELPAGQLSSEPARPRISPASPQSPPYQRPVEATLPHTSVASLESPPVQRPAETAPPRTPTTSRQSPPLNRPAETAASPIPTTSWQSPAVQQPAEAASPRTSTASLESPPTPVLTPVRPPVGGEHENPIVADKPLPDPNARTGILFARGLEAELRGDFSGARRFYFTAAQQGDPAAARNLGRLYDPAFIRQTAVGGIDPDPALARKWYERAIKLGDAGAGPLLEALSAR